MNIMESDPIILLRGAIVDLTTAIRSMRGVGLDSASNAITSNETIVASESADQNIPISNQTAIEPEGMTLNHASVASVTDLNKDIVKAQQKLDQLILTLGEKDKKLEVTRHNLESTEQALGKLENQKAQLTEEVEYFERTKEQFQMLLQERSAVEEHLRAMKSEEAILESKSRQIASREDNLRIGMEQVNQAGELMRKLWPVWLCVEGLKQWKEQIERDVFLDNSPPSFSLLFAAIHNYNASLRDPDNRIFLDALRDLGRRLYQWLKDLGKSEESTAEIVEAWAVAINTECGDRCSIQVAVPGNPANNKWMSFTPRGGSAPDVTSVRSWCVSDNQGRPIHRAEVAV